MDNASNVAAALLLFGAVLGSTPASAESPRDGAFEALSPGNQRVARALHDAQVPPPAPAPGTRPGPRTASRIMTLDEIAAKRQACGDWTCVLRSMRARDLLQEKTINEVLARQPRPVPIAGAAPTVSDSPAASPRTTRPASSLTGRTPTR